MAKQTFIVYLDEFGHIGPFVAKGDPKYNTSPVFGLGGIVMPADQLRVFSTWFYQLKCNLLSYELVRSGEPAHCWEKKGSSLYTTQNVLRYPELRRATFRLFNKLAECDGHVFYVGIEKTASLIDHRPDAMMRAVLREAIKRLDGYCMQRNSGFIIFLDEHASRPQLLTVAQQEMYGPSARRTLLEAPTQVESHRFQLMQASDWICGLIGRMEAYRVRPLEYPDNNWAETYFSTRLQMITIKSGVRKQANITTLTVAEVEPGHGDVPPI